MSRDLVSREFSSGALQLGISLVKEEVGMDPLDDKTNDELLKELKELEEARSRFQVRDCALLG